MKRLHMRVVFLITIFSIASTTQQLVAETAASKVWALRELYTLDYNGYALDFDVASGAWRVRKIPEAKLRKEPVKDEVLAESCGIKVVLEDGTELTPTSLGEGTVTREPFENTMGTGTCFVLRFPPHQGLYVEQRVYAFTERPFVLMGLQVKNDGENPVAIQRLCPACIPPGGVSGWNADVQVQQRKLQLHGGYPVLDKAQPPVMTSFYETARQRSLAIGVLPGEGIPAHTQLQSSAGAWQGGVYADCIPAARLVRGETLRTNDLFIAYGIDKPHMVDLFYSWAFSMLPPRETSAAPIGAWITATEEEGLKDIIRNASWATKAGVRYALIPENWEGRPGSMQGGAPRYPKNMASAAKSIRNAGLTPGLSINPFLARKGEAPWAVQSPDGSIWLDLSHEKAREAARTRIQKMRDWGFAFFVVAPPTIPVEALKSFGLSQAQAENWAFQVVEEAVGDAPVFPACATTLTPNYENWLEAACENARMLHYGVTTGPVRLDASSVKHLAPETLAAMRLWRGPVEIIGTPSTAGRRIFDQLLCQERLCALPLDAEHEIPRLWVVHQEDDNQAYLGSAVVVFPGAQPWHLADVQSAENADIPTVLWQAKDGAFVDAVNRTVAASDTLALYGLTPMTAHPTFMGTSDAAALHLDKVKNLAWEEGGGVLCGQLEAMTEGEATAYVFIPTEWELKSARLNGKPLRSRIEGKRLAFRVNGEASRFEFKFRRK